MIKLSVLIPSTFCRQEMTDKLVSFLFSLKGSEEAEIVTRFDNKEMSIGAKRQMMLEEAKGEYVVFIDSDDWVSDDYFTEILSALESKPDCVGFNIKCCGTKFKKGIASNRFNDWRTLYSVYERTPYQKTPIKREIALEIGYIDKRFGEDYVFSKRLKQSGLIKSEVFIDKELYIYRYKYENHKTKYGFDKE